MHVDLQKRRDFASKVKCRMRLSQVPDDSISDWNQKRYQIVFPKDLTMSTAHYVSQVEAIELFQEMGR